MAAQTYFGNRARAAVVVAGTATGSIRFADLFTVGRGWEVNLEWSVEELYGTDSILRVDEARHTFKPTVELKGCQFYPDNSGTGGIMDMIMNSLNGAAAGTGTVGDNNTCYLMDVYIYQLGTAGTTVFSVAALNCYLEGVPIPFPENDFITLDLKFHGRTASIGAVAYPSS